MSENSKIEWTDHTFNPWWGCQKVGPGCDHCYAEALDKRTGGAHWGPHAERRRTKDWSGPRRWNKNAAKFMAEHDRRQRVFCASMADVFDNAVPAEWRADLWQVIRETPGLDWLIVTKRIGNAPAMVPPDWPQAFRHVTLLITVVNQQEADRDVPKLLAMPAARRGISAEPLLGPINFEAIRYTHAPGFFGSALRWHHRGHCHVQERLVYPTLDWIIVGGESGANARPMHPDWARSIRDQCNSANVAFFFKQWGEWIAGEVCSETRDGVQHGGITRCADGNAHGGRKTHWWSGDAFGGTVSVLVGKSRAGRLLDGREWNEWPASDPVLVAAKTSEAAL